MADMSHADVVRRSPAGTGRFAVSDALRHAGYRRAFDAVRQAIGSLSLASSADRLEDADIAQIDTAFELASRHDLLGPGGVPPWNFLGLWLLHRALGPTHYLESGYFRGSSLLAALGHPKLRRLTGFDPEPGALALPGFPEGLDVELTTEDFGDAAPRNTEGDGALVYFDDHINTARRILEARDKGYRRLVFDDSCGLTGLSQRHWPAMPTVYFIVHADTLSVGDFVDWPSPVGRATDGSGAESQLRVTFDADLIDLCREAQSAIAGWVKLPDLADHVLWRSAAAYPDVSHHLVLMAPD